MKILAINGSPRKGNTHFMLNIILNSARENGAEVELVEIRNKDIKFCYGGDICCSNLKCCIKDEMLNIYPKLEKADIIILASPCYFSNVTAIMKNFMDRCNPYYFNKKLKGKKFFLISVGGYEPSIKEAIRCMKNFLKGIYAKSIGEYYTVADKIGELEKRKIKDFPTSKSKDFEENQKVIKELKNIGKRLSQNG